MTTLETGTSITKRTIGTREIKSYLKDNFLLFLFIFVFLIAGYGFELFNVNMTIDEELAALRTKIHLGYITSNRWGLYLLTKFLLPKQVIPFIPLALTLIFHFAGTLVLLDLLKIQKQLDRIFIAGIGLTWPGLSYLYSFSLVNFAIGFGLLCISISLVILIRAKRTLKLLATLPIAFVFSIYQPLLQPLMMVFLLYLIYNWQKDCKELTQFIIYAFFVVVLGYLLYVGIQQLFFFLYQTEASNYISHYFDLRNMIQNLSIYIQKLWRLFYNIMIGDITFYGIEVRTLPLFLFVSGFFILYHAFLRRKKMGLFFIYLGLLGVFTFLPFIGGILTKGYIPYRSLLGVPIFLMGWAALALKHAGPKTRILLVSLAVVTLFQFASSMNHLFASSAFAYEEDKFLAAQLVQRIEEEKTKTGITDVHQLELVGYVNRPSTPLISRIENIGASFFGWDQGNPSRAAAFLETLGYDHLESLPIDKRAEYVIMGKSMPVWPEPDSVRIVDDVAIIKFGPYSRTQINNLCTLDDIDTLPSGFCP